MSAIAAQVAMIRREDMWVLWPRQARQASLLPFRVAGDIAQQPRSQQRGQGVTCIETFHFALESKWWVRIDNGRRSIGQ